MAPKQWSQEGMEGSTGLHEKFVITVTASRAKVPEKYDGPVWVIEGEFELPDGQRIDSDIRLTMGDFEAGDIEGTYALHSSQDRTKKFNASSGAMKFIKTAFAKDGEEFVFPELVNLLLDRSRVIDGVDLESLDLAAWDGLRLRIDHYSEPATNPKTGVTKDAKRPKVVEYLGTADAPVAGGSGETEAPAAATTTASNTNGSITTEQATLLAKQSGNFLEYLEKVTNAGADPADEVAQQPFYETAKS